MSFCNPTPRDEHHPATGCLVGEVDGDAHGLVERLLVATLCYCFLARVDERLEIRDSTMARDSRFADQLAN